MPLTTHRVWSRVESGPAARTEAISESISSSLSLSPSSTAVAKALIKSSCGLARFCRTMSLSISMPLSAGQVNLGIRVELPQNGLGRHREKAFFAFSRHAQIIGQNFQWDDACQLDDVDIAVLALGLHLVEVFGYRGANLHLFVHHARRKRRDRQAAQALVVGTVLGHQQIVREAVQVIFLRFRNAGVVFPIVKAQR